MADVKLLDKLCGIDEKNKGVKMSLAATLLQREIFMSYQITLFFFFSLGFLGLVLGVEVFHFNLKNQAYSGLAPVTDALQDSEKTQILKASPPL